MTLREVTAEETADLRRQVLRGGRPVALPGDDVPSYGLGVFVDGVLVATGNVRREAVPGAPTGDGWRVRGMATADGHRGQGHGRAVLDGLLAHVAANGGGPVWCNARTPARAFYERAGFVVTDEPWDDPEIGPHVRMVRPGGSPASSP